jgi:hypothetical protein
MPSGNFALHPPVHSDFFSGLPSCGHPAFLVSAVESSFRKSCLLTETSSNQSVVSSQVCLWGVALSGRNRDALAKQFCPGALLLASHSVL